MKDDTVRPLGDAVILIVMDGKVYQMTRGKISDAHFERIKDDQADVVLSALQTATRGLH